MLRELCPGPSAGAQFWGCAWPMGLPVLLQDFYASLVANHELRGSDLAMYPGPPTADLLETSGIKQPHPRTTVH